MVQVSQNATEEDALLTDVCFCFSSSQSTEPDLFFPSPFLSFNVGKKGSTSRVFSSLQAGLDALKSPMVTKVHAPSRIGNLEGDKLIVKTRTLEIIWGGDTRYWCIPDPANPTDPIQLL